MCDLSTNKPQDAHRCVENQKKLLPCCIGCNKGATRSMTLEDVPFWAYETFRRMHNTDMAEGEESSLQVATGKVVAHVAHTLHKVHLEGAI